MPYQAISGTFLDEISVDIPSQNWGEREWAREFDTFVEAGIDTPSCSSGSAWASGWPARAGR